MKKHPAVPVPPVLMAPGERFGRRLTSSQSFVVPLLPFGSRPDKCPGCGREERGEFEATQRMRWRTIYIEEGPSSSNGHQATRYLKVRCSRCGFKFKTKVFEDQGG